MIGILIRKFVVCEVNLLSVLDVVIFVFNVFENLFVVVVWKFVDEGVMLLILDIREYEGVGESVFMVNF